MNERTDKVPKSPGLLLQELLIQLFKDEQISYSSIDHSLKMENRFTEFAFKSAINYVLRRVIHRAQYIFKKKPYADLYSGEFRQELFDFFKFDTCFPEEYHERMVDLLIDILNVSSKKIPEGIRNRKWKEMIVEKYSCYLSSKPLDYSLRKAQRSKDNRYRIPELDHIWPQAFGGLSDSSNLEYASGHCNEHKKDIIDKTDYHFESISKGAHRDDNIYDDVLCITEKLAIAAKDDFKCQNCFKPLKSFSAIHYVIIDDNDSCHLFNLEVICDKCFTTRRHH